MVWLNLALPLHQKLNDSTMRNTDYNLNKIADMISSESSFQALRGLMQDLGLEVEDTLAL